MLAIMVGVAIPMANLYAVLLLTRGQRLPILQVVREVTLNPFLLASLGGALVALSGWPVPILLAGFVDRLADAALPIVLLSIGAALAGVNWWPPSRFALALHGIKLIALPFSVSLAALVAVSFGVRADDLGDLAGVRRVADRHRGTRAGLTLRQ